MGVAVDNSSSAGELALYIETTNKKDGLTKWIFSGSTHALKNSQLVSYKMNRVEGEGVTEKFPVHANIMHA